MKKIALKFIILLSSTLFAQEQGRFFTLENQLELLALENESLNESFKLDFQSNEIQLSVADILLAISSTHNLNIAVDSSLKSLFIETQFADATVKEVILFLCKEKELTIDFTRNIMAFKPYVELALEEVILPAQINYNVDDKTLSVDAKKNALHEVFRKITQITGINIFFKPELENLPLSIYIVNSSIEQLLNHIAQTHGLHYTKSQEGSFLFDFQNDEVKNTFFQSSFLTGSEPLGYTILDTIQKRISIKVQNNSTEALLRNLAEDLKIDYYLASPFGELGVVTLKANNISFDELLYQIFSNYEIRSNEIPEVKTSQNLNQSQNKTTNNQVISNRITYKKEGETYFFGAENLLSLRSVKVIPLLHRSIEILDDPFRIETKLNNNLNNQNYTNYSNSNFTQNRNPNNSLSNVGFIQSNSTSGQNQNQVTLENIIPEELKSNLDIKVDPELNSFFVSGSHTQIKRFENFIHAIDLPVPVILIEVMFLEINRSSTIEAGISWGIGDSTEKTKGDIFPSTDLTLNAQNINRIIGGLNGFGTLNLGKVIPEFFSKIKVLETNGVVKILSTPKMTTLNGHRAQFTNNETSYYAVTSQNIYGSQIPQSSEIRNYFPVQAGLTLSIKPYVGGDKTITLDIFVTQSTFTERVEPDAPPGIEAREFSSIIRMKDQDLVILGGLEQDIKRNSGEGVPFLAKIPIIKWLFSQRVRSGEKRKLTVLIKPTRID